MHDRAQVTRFFDGLGLVERGAGGMAARIGARGQEPRRAVGRFGPQDLRRREEYRHIPGPGERRVRLCRIRRPCHAAESDVARRRFDGVALAGGGAVAQAVVGRAEKRASLDDPAGNVRVGLRMVVAVLGSLDAGIVRRAARR